MLEDSQKLDALEEELRRDLEAIVRVRKMMAIKNGALGKPASNENQLTLIPTTAAFVSGSENAEDMDAPATSIRGMIVQTMNASPLTRWTTAKMLAHLQSINFPLEAKKPIYTIGQSMQKLAERGDIRLLKRGLGNRPNIYAGKEPPKPEPSATSEIITAG